MSALLPPKASGGMGDKCKAPAQEPAGGPSDLLPPGPWPPAFLRFPEPAVVSNSLSSGRTPWAAALGAQGGTPQARPTQQGPWRPTGSLFPAEYQLSSPPLGRLPESPTWQAAVTEKVGCDLPSCHMGLARCLPLQVLPSPSLEGPMK